MSANENALPFIPTVLPIALPAATPVLVAVVGLPGVRQDVSLSALPSGNTYIGSLAATGKGVVMRGVAVVTQSGVAGAVTLQMAQGTFVVGVGTTFPVNLTAGEVANIPFEFYFNEISLGANNNFQLYATGTTPATLNMLMVHAWALP
jgi:hypothetical protein